MFYILFLQFLLPGIAFLHVTQWEFNLKMFSFCKAFYNAPTPSLISMAVLRWVASG